MKKVLGYIRVSTELQKIKENSINNQIQSINEYCNRNDFDLVEVYKQSTLV
jgi:DNA invertase Pin-like site-specific DNA recombinase